jgi:ABC-type lipoprotein release transport system permease subunit
MMPVSMGVAAGSAGALLTTRLLRTLLFDVSSRDMFIYAVVVLCVICVGLLANLLPARRAALTDALRALHFE